MTPPDHGVNTRSNYSLSFVVSSATYVCPTMCDVRIGPMSFAVCATALAIGSDGIVRLMASVQDTGVICSLFIGVDVVRPCFDHASVAKRGV